MSCQPSGGVTARLYSGYCFSSPAFAGRKLARPRGSLSLPGPLEERRFHHGIHGAAGVHLVERGAGAEEIAGDEDAVDQRVERKGAAKLRAGGALGIEKADGAM